MRFSKKKGSGGDMPTALLSGSHVVIAIGADGCHLLPDGSIYVWDTPIYG